MRSNQSTPAKTLADVNLWAGLWIRWNKRKVFLISVIRDGSGLCQVHYEYKDAIYVDLDIPEVEVGKALLIEV